jgi:hypothetical protein
VAAEPDEPEPPDELLELLELLAPELLPDVAPDELEPLGTGALVLTCTVAAAGVPKSASPSTLVSARAKRLPLAVFETGTVTDLAVESPSLQVTVPLVAT